MDVIVVGANIGGSVAAVFAGPVGGLHAGGELGQLRGFGFVGGRDEGEPDFQDLAIFWSLNGYMMVFGCLY